MSISDRLRTTFETSTVLAARQIVGQLLVRIDEDGCRRSGRIVETEAYTQSDPSSHSYRGPGERNAQMFGTPGTAYVYLIYGVHHCLNITTAPAGTGEAVLIRALEPLDGLHAMMQARSVTDIEALCNGPGKLCQALGIDRTFNGTDLLDSKSPLRIEPERYHPPQRIDSTLRIGLSIPQREHLRFVDGKSRFLSRKRVPESAVTQVDRRR